MTGPEGRRNGREGGGSLVLNFLSPDSQNSMKLVSSSLPSHRVGKRGSDRSGHRAPKRYNWASW